MDLESRGCRDILHRVHLQEEDQSGDQAPGRPRIPDLNTVPGQEGPFDSRRYHALSTTTPATQRDTVTADQVCRQHAVIEDVHADLKASELARKSSGRFAANSAWLVAATTAFNLARPAATAAGHTPMAAATTSICQVASDQSRGSSVLLGAHIHVAPAKVLALARRLAGPVEPCHQRPGHHRHRPDHQAQSIRRTPKDPSGEARADRRPPHGHPPKTSLPRPTSDLLIKRTPPHET